MPSRAAGGASSQSLTRNAAVEIDKMPEKKAEHPDNGAKAGRSTPRGAQSSADAKMRTDKSRGCIMLKKKDYPTIAAQLQEFLAERFEEVTVEIADNVHYKGTNVVVTSPTFDGLLPEQRYHHVVQAIPQDFYESYLRSGVVWFELAPRQSGRDYMRMPRSEDIESEESRIQSGLQKARFFERFAEALEGTEDEPSRDDFVLARQVLSELGWAEPDQLNASLYFVRQGAFCDADIVDVVLPALEGEE
jgi:hypothetical protein